MFPVCDRWNYTLVWFIVQLSFKLVSFYVLTALNRNPSWDRRAAHPWAIDGPSQFLPGYKNTFLRDLYEKILEMNNLHNSISSREWSECKNCIRNRLTNTGKSYLSSGFRKREREVTYPITAGWTPNKQFCFSKSAPFRILSPHSKLWYHICSHVVK